MAEADRLAQARFGTFVFTPCTLTIVSLGMAQRDLGNFEGLLEARDALLAKLPPTLLDLLA